MLLEQLLCRVRGVRGRAHLIGSRWYNARTIDL
jgi:hypothetical protein